MVPVNSSLDVSPETSADLSVEDRALAAVSTALQGVNRLGVAFSGGVDSSVLLAAAVRVLGPSRVVAILGVSPSLASDERAAAHEVAQVIGAALVEVATDEGSNPAYVANGPDRCFHCKNELFTKISDEVVATYALDAVAYGENLDDAQRPDRPGSRAAVEHRVLAPLRDAGLDKAAVRAVARAWALPCAEKPAAPCLASRIPHHSEVSPEKLRQIDVAESGLRRLGLGDFRVRHHDDIARLELPGDDLARAAQEPLRSAVREAVLAAGFRYVVLDLGTMQPGAFTLTVLQGHA
ncbi:ATP-dependent sacrificial sulfur transferase LarE [Microlunatus spumicola]|uniref:ATP-dependent sacrificial sulfur transferase LarE n=1 Tax=Microlunatus spumicola TaxID=81499 RepID=A0ABP6X2X5_9ACTN